MILTVKACIWYGVQAYLGGNCVYIMIRSIWKSWVCLTPGGVQPSYPSTDTLQDRETIPNTFSESSGTTTADWVSFFIFWLCSLPAIWFPVHQIRHLFTVKSYVVPAAGIAFLIWTVVRAGGPGPIVSQPNTVHGADLAWQIILGSSYFPHSRSVSSWF